MTIQGHTTYGFQPNSPAHLTPTNLQRHGGKYDEYHRYKEAFVSLTKVYY